MNGTSSSPGLKGRRFPRYAIDLRLGVSVFREGETISLWGRSNEIAEDGLGATLSGELEPGEVVSLDLTLPVSSLPLKLRASVRYRDGLRHGFEFLIQNPQQRESLQRLCEMLAGQQ